MNAGAKEGATEHTESTEGRAFAGSELMPYLAQFSAKNVWQRARTPYGSFLVLTASVACFMTLVGGQVIWGALCVLMLFAWCFYALICMVIQDSKGPVEAPRWALRQMFTVTACIAVMVGAVVNHWPLRLRFAVSRPQLDRYADQLVDGRQLSTPRAAADYS